MNLNRRSAIKIVVIAALAAAAVVVPGCACTPEVPLPILQEPEYRWPLTGELAPDEPSLQRRAVSVKIENARASRPQSGLGDADVVYETLAEGGVTRFNAIFHSRQPETIGPVRSARSVDTDIVPQYNALLAYSGASRVIRQMLETAGIDDIGFERYQNSYRRDESRRAPHNLYSGIPTLVDTARQAGFDVDTPPSGLAFGEAPPSATSTATVVEIPFSDYAQVAWEWDSSAGEYRRLMDGVPHGDMGADQPYSAANVVVILTRIAESGFTDSTGTPTLDIELTGSGDAVIFRDGQRFEARWSATSDAPPTFATPDGESMPLSPGRTWFEVVPLGFGVDSQ